MRQKKTRPVEAIDEQTLDIIGHKLWSSNDGLAYFSVSDTSEKLPPDFYELKISNMGPYFYRLNFTTEDLVQFEDETIDKVVKEIDIFWNNKERFEKFGFAHRRGILLYGPPGAGKTCTVKLIIKRVIDLGGVAVSFRHPDLYAQCMRVFRLIQPQTPVVAVMEDLEALLEHYHESHILNLLDGVDGFQNIVYLATTNYPEDLEPRIKNRPSRFDRRYHIGYPCAKSRAVYIRHLQEKIGENTINIDKWVKATEKYTPAHIKDVFISVFLFGHHFDEAINMMNEMRTKKISSANDDFSLQRAGFSV